MKFYKFGKDMESLPCVELDDGTLILATEAVLALIEILKVDQAKLKEKCKEAKS